MENLNETRFEMKGAQFPDRGPFLTVSAEVCPDRRCCIQINFNALTQIQKAQIALATTKQLAQLAKEALESLKPVPNSAVHLVVGAMSDMVELAEKSFDILQPPTSSLPETEMRGFGKCPDCDWANEPEGCNTERDSEQCKLNKRPK